MHEHLSASKGAYEKMTLKSKKSFLAWATSMSPVKIHHEEPYCMALSLSDLIYFCSRAFLSGLQEPPPATPKKLAVRDA